MIHQVSTHFLCAIFNADTDGLTDRELEQLSGYESRFGPLDNCEEVMHPQFDEPATTFAYCDVCGLMAEVCYLVDSADERDEVLRSLGLHDDE